MDPQRASPRASPLRRPTFPAVLGMLVAVIVVVPLLEGLAHLRVGVMLGLAGLTIPILAVAAASDRQGTVASPFPWRRSRPSPTARRCRIGVCRSGRATAPR